MYSGAETRFRIPNMFDPSPPGRFEDQFWREDFGRNIEKQPRLRSGPEMVLDPSLEQHEFGENSFEHGIADQLELTRRTNLLTQSLVRPNPNQASNNNPTNLTQQIETPEEQPANSQTADNSQDNSAPSREENEHGFEEAISDLQLAFVENRNADVVADAIGRIFEYGTQINGVDNAAYQELREQNRNLIDSRIELQNLRSDLERIRFNDSVSYAYADGLGSDHSLEDQLMHRIGEKETDVRRLEPIVRNLENRWSANLNRFERTFLSALFNEELEGNVTNEIRQRFSTEQARIIADAYRMIHAPDLAQRYYEMAIDHSQNLIEGVWYRLQSLDMDIQSNETYRVRTASREIEDIREELAGFETLREALNNISELTNGGDFVEEELNVTLDILRGLSEDSQRSSGEISQYLNQSIEYIEEIKTNGNSEIAAEELRGFLEQTNTLLGNLDLLDEIDALTIRQLHAAAAFLRYGSGGVSAEEAELLDGRLRSLENQILTHIQESGNASRETKRMLGEALNQVISLYTARGEVGRNGLRQGGGVISQMAQSHDNQGIQEAMDRLGNMVLEFKNLIGSDVTGETDDLLYGLYSQMVVKLFVNGARAANRPQEALANLRYLSSDHSTDTEGILLAYNSTPRFPSKTSGLDNRIRLQNTSNINISDGHDFTISESDENNGHRNNQYDQPSLPSILTVFDIRRFDLNLIEGASEGQGIEHTQIFQDITQDLHRTEPQLFDEHGNLREDVDFTDTDRGDSAFWRTLSDYLTTDNQWRNFGIPAGSAIACYTGGALLGVATDGLALPFIAGGCALVGSGVNSAVNVGQNWDIIRQSEITGISEITGEQAFRNYVTYGVMTSLNAVISASLARPAFLFGRAAVSGTSRGIQGAGAWITNNGGLRSAVTRENLLEMGRVLGGNVGEGWSSLTLGEQVRIGGGLATLGTGQVLSHVDENDIGVDDSIGFYVSAAGATLLFSGGVHVPLRLGLAEETAAAMARSNMFWVGWADDAMFAGIDIYSAERYALTQGNYLGVGLIEQGEVDEQAHQEHPERPIHRLPSENRATWVGDVGLALAGGVFIRYDYRQMDPAARRWLQLSLAGEVVDALDDPIFRHELPQFNNIFGGVSGAATMAVLTGRITGVNAMGIIWSLPFKVGTEMMMLWQSGENPFQGLYSNPDYQRRLTSFAAETQISSVPIMTILRGRSFLNGFPLGRRLSALAYRIPMVRGIPSAINLGVLANGTGANVQRVSRIIEPTGSITNGVRNFEIRAPSAESHQLSVSAVNGQRPRFQIDGREVSHSYLRRFGYRWSRSRRVLLDANSQEVPARGQHIFNIRTSEQATQRPVTLRAIQENGRTILELAGRRITPTALRQMGYRWDSRNQQLIQTEIVLRNDNGGYISNTMIEQRPLINHSPGMGYATYNVRNGSSTSSITVYGRGVNAEFQINDQIVTAAADELAARNLYWDAARNRLYGLTLGWRGDMVLGSTRFTHAQYNELITNQRENLQLILQARAAERIQARLRAGGDLTARETSLIERRVLNVQSSLDEMGYFSHNGRFARASMNNPTRQEIFAQRPTGELNGINNSGEYFRTFRTTRLFGNGDLWVRIYNTAANTADDLALGGDGINVFRGRSLSTARFTLGSSAIAAPFLMGTAYGMSYGIFQHTSNGDPNTQPIQRAANYGFSALVTWPYVQSPLGYDTPQARIVGYLIGFFANGCPAAVFPPYRNTIPGFESFVMGLDNSNRQSDDPVANRINWLSEATQPYLFFSYPPMRSEFGQGDVFNVSQEILTSVNLFDNFWGPTQENRFEYEHVADEAFIGAFDCMLDMAINHPDVNDVSAFTRFVNASPVCNQDNNREIPEEFRLHPSIRRGIIRSQQGINTERMTTIFRNYAENFRHLVGEIRTRGSSVENERRMVAQHAAVLTYFMQRYTDYPELIASLEKLRENYPEIFARIPSMRTREDREIFNIMLNGSGAGIDQESIEANSRIRIRAVDLQDDRDVPAVISDMRRRRQ